MFVTTKCSSAEFFSEVLLFSEATFPSDIINYSRGGKQQLKSISCKSSRGSNVFRGLIQQASADTLFFKISLWAANAVKSDLYSSADLSGDSERVLSPLNWLTCPRPFYRSKNWKTRTKENLEMWTPLPVATPLRLFHKHGVPSAYQVLVWALEGSRPEGAPLNPRLPPESHRTS